MIRRISDQAAALRARNPGYIAALLSGYLLMGVTVGVQFLLAPLYLTNLGPQSFGQLMIMLNLVNFAAVGITWMSGGLVRIAGERWAESDMVGFRDVLAVGKYVYTLYALIVVFLGWCLISLAPGFIKLPGIPPSLLLLLGVYLVINYEALPERQAFFGINRQPPGNYIELLRVILFAGLVLIFVPRFPNLFSVVSALIAGVLCQRLLSSYYWSRKVGGVGWARYHPRMRKLLKRLIGAQGAGYVSYGVLLLILQADTMIIGAIGGAEAAGRFVIIWKIPEALGLILWKIPSAIEPRVISLDAAKEYGSLRDLYFAGRRWFIALCLVVAVAYGLGGKWLATLWVGEFAPEVGWMYHVAGTALFFTTIARWPISVSYAMIKLRPLVMVASIEVCAKLIFTLTLFSTLDIAAPMVAATLTHCLLVAFLYQRMGVVSVRQVATV